MSPAVLPLVLHRGARHLLVLAVECPEPPAWAEQGRVKRLVLEALERGVPALSEDEALGLALVYGGLTLLYRTNEGFVPVSRAQASTALSIARGGPGARIGVLEEALDLVSRALLARSLPLPAGAEYSGARVTLSSPGPCRPSPTAAPLLLGGNKS